MIGDQLEAAAEASADAELWRDLPSSDYSESFREHAPFTELRTLVSRYVEISACQGRLQKAAAISFRDDAVRANRKRNNNVPINDEQDTVFFGHIQIENLVTMPENTGEFVRVQRRMPPIRREE